MASSWLYLCEPERSQRSLRPEIGERDLERRRAGDQDHVISYSHLAQRRTRSQQSLSRDLAQPAPGPVALDRALDCPADRHADPALRLLGRNGEPDQRPPAVEAPAADSRLEVRPPTDPRAPLHLQCASYGATSLELGQPRAALATAIAEHADPATSAHPAQESVDAPAIPFLGLIGPFDRASVAEAMRPTCDTASITSLCARRPCGITSRPHCLRYTGPDRKSTRLNSSHV